MRYRFPIKRLSDDRAILNLGCGTRMHLECNNLDFSPYTFLVKHINLAKLLYKTKIISENRWENILKMDPHIISWNILKGIPFPDDTFDVIYSSHVIEHIEKDFVPIILKECHRTLKKSGIVRIVVPDLQVIVEKYQRVLQSLDNIDIEGFNDHEKVLDDLFGQMVRKKPVGTSTQSTIVRFIEHIIRGGIEKRGELHKWMYDKYSLSKLLKIAGFKQIFLEMYDTSRIKDWDKFFLDINEDGTPYKKDSLYIEAIK